MVNAVPQLSSRLVYVLMLGLLVGLVGCTAAGVPMSAVSVNPPVGNTPPGNTSQGNLPLGNGPVSNNATPGSLTPSVPYVPYPMPQPNMPEGILGFVPSDSALVCPTPRVSLTVHLTDAMRKDRSFDPSTVTLTLEGKNILPEIQVIAPMIYPQSQVTLTYVPSSPLSLGAHQVKFTYPSPGGHTTLTLNFTVASIPCK